MSTHLCQNFWCWIVIWLVENDHTRTCRLTIVIEHRKIGIYFILNYTQIINSLLGNEIFSSLLFIYPSWIWCLTSLTIPPSFRIFFIVFEAFNFGYFIPNFYASFTLLCWVHKINKLCLMNSIEIPWSSKHFPKFSPQ